MRRHSRRRLESSTAAKSTGSQWGNRAKESIFDNVFYTNLNTSLDIRMGAKIKKTRTDR